MSRGRREVARDLRLARRLLDEHDFPQVIRVLENLSDRASSPQQKEKINELLLVANQALRNSSLDQPFSPADTAEQVSREEKRAPERSGPEVTESGIDRDPAEQETGITEADHELEAVLAAVQEESAPVTAVESCAVHLYWGVEPKQNAATDPDQGGFDVSLIVGFSRGHVIRVCYLRIQKAWSRWPVVLGDPEIVFEANVQDPSISNRGELVVRPLDLPQDFSPSFHRKWFSSLFCPKLGWNAEVWIEIDSKHHLELEAWCFRRRVWRWTRKVPEYQRSPVPVLPKVAQS